MVSIYNYNVESIHGGIIDFEVFRGKKLMIVNVASECGYTGQYQQLQEISEQYSEILNIIGFPCNDFGGQEPGNEDEIAEFCRINYGVTFTITKKITIKGNRHPIYEWLCRKDLNGRYDSEVEWNFQKYLIDERGSLTGILKPAGEPFSEKLLTWISPSLFD